MEKLKNLMAVFVTFVIMSLMISLAALACPADGSECKDCIGNRMKSDCPACAPIMRCMAQCLWDKGKSQKQCVKKCNCDGGYPKVSDCKKCLSQCKCSCSMGNGL